MSLTQLGLCIKALTENSAFIPFKNSKLTRFLAESLGGNSRTTLLVTSSKLQIHLEESIGTLRFAQRAKLIKTNAKANVVDSPEKMKAMIISLQQQVAAYKYQLI